MARSGCSFRGMARLVVVAVFASGLVAVASAGPGAADGNEAPGAPLAFRSITVGDGHSCALLAGGALKCWGDGGSGRLGLGDTDARGEPAWV